MPPGFRKSTSARDRDMTLNGLGPLRVAEGFKGDNNPQFLTYPKNVSSGPHSGRFRVMSVSSMPRLVFDSPSTVLKA